MTRAILLLLTAALLAATTACRAPPAPRPLRVAFFTDVHTRTEWETPQAVEQTADAINREQPDLAIAGGDLITDGFISAAPQVADRWRSYLESLHERIVAPVFPTIGNHDLIALRPRDGTPPAADPRREFMERFGLASSYRMLATNDWVFFFLDSIQPADDKLVYHGGIDGAQMEWIRGELARLPAETPLVLVTHIPLLTVFYQATQGALSAARADRVVTNNLEVLDLFAGHNLRLVLQGHTHAEEFIRWRGITFISGGAVCGQWWRGPWYGTPEGFGLVTLQGTNITWRYIPYRWTARRPPGE